MAIETKILENKSNRGMKLRKVVQKWFPNLCAVQQKDPTGGACEKYRCPDNPNPTVAGGGAKVAGGGHAAQSKVQSSKSKVQSPRSRRELATRSHHRLHGYK